MQNRNLGDSVWYIKFNKATQGIIWGMQFGDDATKTTNFLTYRMENGDKVKDTNVFTTREECISYIIDNL